MLKWDKIQMTKTVLITKTIFVVKNICVHKILNVSTPTGQHQARIMTPRF
jgi:hypothetical protein